MVREQSKIRHFLRFGNSRSSTSDPLQSQEPSRGSARDISSVTGTLSSTHEPLPRLGCLFHWTGAYQSGPTIPRATDGSAGRVAQEEGERSEVVSTQIIPKAIKRPGSELVPAAFGRGVDTILKPFDGKDTAVESAVRIVGGDIVDSPMRALVGSQGDAAQQALDCMTPISCVGEMAVDVERGHSTTANIRAISDTNLQTLRIFNSVVITITNVHPYTQIALGMLTSASQLLIDRANLDHEMSGLLTTVKSVYEFLAEKDTVQDIDSMRETLGVIARVMGDVVQFITGYSNAKSFWNRLGKDLHSETQVIIAEYAESLHDLMQQYRDRAFRDTQIRTRRVLEGFDLEGMDYAAGASLDSTKVCLDGTRVEVLQEIINWITDPDPNARRIFWLHGRAGRGKSTIAHTIGLWMRNVGGPGVIFCFARNRQVERRQEKIFTTIARDLANAIPAFQCALADVIAEDRSLKTTPDVMQQWKRLILEPLSKINGEIVGNVVVVIDALDESGPGTSRAHILSLLSSPEAAYVPPNVRILLTSRPLPDIEHALSFAPHVKAISLDDIPLISVERDIGLYVSKELDQFTDIGAKEIQLIVKKSDGLFEWARLACSYMKAGGTLGERYSDLMTLQSGEGRSLLDATYFTILKGVIPESGEALERYRSVMCQILMTLEPLPMVALSRMREKFPDIQDHYDITLVLEVMSPVLGGIMEHTSPVVLCHASFYDFLTDPSRSGVYFIDTSDAKDLAFATLQILCDELQFNICGLESSYLANAEVTDLPERIRKNISPHLSYSCQFWTQHLEKTTFDLALAVLVRAIVGSEKVLFWLEIMSLIGVVEKGVGALASVATWLLGQDHFKDTLALAQDGIKFIQNFSHVMVYSTPHLYASLLTFIPPNTLLSTMLMPKFHLLAGIAVGDLKDWPVVQLALQGHTAAVKTVTFSPDGKMIISGSRDRTVRVWDVLSGMQIGGPFQGHTSEVNSVAFSPDGKRIVSGSTDGTVRVWDAERGVQFCSSLEGHTSTVLSVAFSSDGKKVVSGSRDKTVRVWDVERGIQIGSPLKGHNSAVFSAAFFPDGKKIVSGSWDNTVRVWDAERGVQLGSPLEGHTSAVFSVALSSDGKRIVSGSWDKTVRVWDADRGVQIGGPLEGHSSAVFSVAFSPDRKMIVSGSGDGTVRMWDAERGTQICSPLQGHSDVVFSVAFSPDGRMMVTGSDDNTVQVWDVSSGTWISDCLQSHTSEVNSVAFSQDGKRIITGSNDKSVRMWDAERGVEIGSPLQGHTAAVFSVACSPDGKKIVSGSKDRSVRLWDSERCVQVGSPLECHTSAVKSVAFSSDGKRIISGSWDKTVRVWDAERGIQIGSPLKGHTSAVLSVAFSPDGKRIVSGSDDRTVRVWDAERSVQIGNLLQGHTSAVFSVAFSPDGKRIVSGSDDRTVRVWDVERGVQIGSPLQGHNLAVYSVSVSPDGKWIASGSRDKGVRVWDAERGVQLGSPLEHHKSAVFSVAFSPDGKRVVSGSGDETVRVWDVHSYEDFIGYCKALELVQWDPKGVSAPPGTANIVKGCICFSPITSFALQDNDGFLDGIIGPRMCGEPVKLHADGWIRGPSGRLLLWIPPAFRQPFYSMWNTVVMPRGCCIELDLSQMVHGNNWHRCLQKVSQK